MLTLLIALTLTSPRITQPAPVAAASSGGGYATIQEDGTPLTQRTSVNFTGANITCSDSGGITVCNVSAAAGAGLSFEQSVSLTEAGYFTQAVSNAGVGATSKFVCRPFGTTADSLTPEVIGIAGLQATVSDLSAGVGLNLNVWNPNGLVGTVRFHCTTGG